MPALHWQAAREKDTCMLNLDLAAPSDAQQSGTLELQQQHSVFTSACTLSQSTLRSVQVLTARKFCALLLP